MCLPEGPEEEREEREENKKYTDIGGAVREINSTHLTPDTPLSMREVPKT